MRVTFTTPGSRGLSAYDVWRLATGGDGTMGTLQDYLAWTAGKAPAHVWTGTTLAFARPDGSMADGVDLRGATGPAPAHVWTGTALAFARPDGSMAPGVDLRGAPGMSVTIRIATAATAAALSAQYPADLIVVPQ